MFSICSSASRFLAVRLSPMRGLCDELRGIVSSSFNGLVLWQAALINEKKINRDENYYLWEDQGK